MFKRKHGKRILLLIGLVSMGIIFPSWGWSAQPNPGDVIDASNIDQYKDFFPSIMQRFIKDGWGLESPVAVHVKGRDENLPPKIFREMSSANKEKVGLNNDSSLSGYVSGTPFPDPKEPGQATKVMWNLYYRWRGDQFYYPDGYWTTLKRKSGTVSHANTEIEMLFYTHRNSVDPVPSLENAKGLYSALTLNSNTPPNKDMVTLSWRYEDPNKSDDMWTYIPTLRRTLRLMSSERANPVRGTPYTWDDFYGFDGKIMDYNNTIVGKKPMLGLMNQQTLCVPGTKYEQGYDHPVLAGASDPYELRDVYVVEVSSKNPRNPEMKKTLFVSNDIWYPIYTMVYDKQGNLWKGMVNGFRKINTPQGDTGPWCSVSSFTDFKTGFWTQNLLNKICTNCEMDYNRFNPGALGTF
jgi:hypothetical protein